MDRPLLVLSDVHVSRKYGSEVGSRLADVLRSHRDSEVVLAGDIFDLSLDAGAVPVEQSLTGALAPHEELLSALRASIKAGQKVTFIPGNHDAGLDGTKPEETLKTLLGAPNDACVEVSPWFIRRGDVHIEHGHLYDPDCAPDHPLAPPNAESEGLGTALMRRFVSPNDALDFAHKNGTTPLVGLLKAFEKWGPKAPRVIFNYFRTAGGLCVDSLLKQEMIETQKTEGGLRLPRQSQLTGVSEQALTELLAGAPVPTHHEFGALFRRLYFDRIFAGTSLALGLGLLGAAGLSGAADRLPLISTTGSLTTVGALLSTLGGAYLVKSKDNKKRYGGTVVGQLGAAAQQVRTITGSKLVVFGHTHVEVDDGGYVNLGSFGYGRPKRPYLLVATDGSHQRAFA